MSSSYPAPPAPSVSAGPASAAPSTTQTQPTLSPRQQQPHHQFDNGALSGAFTESSTAATTAEAAAAAAAAAAAHQGLRALQAAPAVPGHAPSQSPVAPQYPAPMQHSPLSDTQFSPTPSIPLAQQPHKVTRLRRACDMCSQRKVKVSPLTQPRSPIPRAVGIMINLLGVLS